VSATGVPIVRRNQEAEQRHTNPLTFGVRAVALMTQALVPIGIAGFSILRDAGDIWKLGALALLLVVVGAAAAGVSFLHWRRFTYRVGEADVRVESGILSRAARSVPYERIQDVSLEQALIPRLFGLVEVKFETGAGGKEELKLSYLARSEGERLRELVRERRDGLEPVPAGADEQSGVQDDELLFRMPPRRIFTFGLFEFSLVVVAGVAGAAQQFEFLLPFDLWDLEGWQERLAGPGARLAALGAATQVIGAMLAVGSLLALGFVTGLARTTLREWGFVLTRNAKGLRRRRGLLTRTDVVMPVHRVQALKVETGLVRHRFGWQALKLVSLAQDAGNASHVVAPFARQEEIAPIVRATGFALPDGETRWHRASRAYAIHRGAIWLGGAILIAAVQEAVLLAVPNLESGWILWLPLILPLAGAIAAAREWWNWRFRRYALTHWQLFHRHGWLSPALDIASRVKLQSVEIAQGPLARRGDYATLHLGLAGGKLELPGLPLNEATRLAGALLASMERRDFNELAGGAQALSGLHSERSANSFAT
jgi:putative membrane protein